MRPAKETLLRRYRESWPKTRLLRYLPPDILQPSNYLPIWNQAGSPAGREARSPSIRLASVHRSDTRYSPLAKILASLFATFHTARVNSLAMSETLGKCLRRGLDGRLDTKAPGVGEPRRREPPWRSPVAFAEGGHERGNLFLGVFSAPVRRRLLSAEYAYSGKP
jgi:hypothetical protein